jgi:lambda family phage minor tail protein L
MAVGVEADLQHLTPPAEVELFIVDLNPISGAWDPPVETPLYYFCNSLDSDATPIIFRGDTYTPISIEAEGFGKTQSGSTMPRPKIRIGNADGYTSGLLRSYQDMIGAGLTRLITLEPYLDGHDEADPLKCREQSSFLFNRLTSEGKFHIEWELRLSTDQRLQFPRRPITPFCRVVYRGEYCGWDGDNFDINDVKEGEPLYLGTDECAKRLSSCVCRWQETDQSQVMPFAGFPGSARPLG